MKRININDINKVLTECKKRGKIPRTVYLGYNQWKELKNLAASGTERKGLELLKSSFGSQLEFKQVYLNDYLATESPHQ